MIITPCVKHTVTYLRNYKEGINTGSQYHSVEVGWFIDSACNALELFEKKYYESRGENKALHVEIEVLQKKLGELIQQQPTKQ